MTRQWLYRTLLIGGVWLVVSRLTELEHLAQTLRQGRWAWVMAAAGLQTVYYLVYAGLYRAAFAAVDIRLPLAQLLPTVFASLAVNVAAPTGGVSGAALFVDDAARRGYPAGRAAAAVLLALIADLTAFVVVLLAGLAYLFTYHDLKPYEVAGAAVLLLVIGGLSAVLLLGLWRREWLLRMLAWVQRSANRVAAVLSHRGFLSETWASKTAGEFAEASVMVAAHLPRLARALGIALCAHGLDLISLYLLFLAFHGPVGPGILVAGYAMGILFWIVAVTPQGIGVVEGVMALVFASLGVPAERSTVIAVAFRGLTFWLPLLAGFVLLRRVQTFQVAARISPEAWGVHVAAGLAALIGAMNVLSAITPSLDARLEILVQAFPIGIRHGARLITALAGFGLLALAGNLLRRKRVAWWLTLLLLVISAVTHLIKGLDYEEAMLAATLAALLMILRPHFHAGSDPPSAGQGLRTLLGAFGFTLAYGAAGFYLLDRHFQFHYSITAALAQTVIMFTEFSDPGLQPLTGFGRYFADSIYGWRSRRLAMPR